MKKHNNIDNNQTLEVTTKVSPANNVTTKTNTNLIESLKDDFVRKYEFLSKLESFTDDIDDNTSRIIGEEYKLSEKKIKEFEPILSEYIDVLDDTIMIKLYNFGFEDFVLNHMDVFKGKLSNEFIMQLFIDGHMDHVSTKTMNKRKIIDSLVGSKEYEAIINSISFFKGCIQYMVNKMIDGGSGEYICKNLSRGFDEIDIYQTVEKMEKAGVDYQHIFSFIQRYKAFLDNNSTNLQ